jgi:hypothetical protein
MSKKPTARKPKPNARPSKKANKYVYFFGGGKADGNRNMKDLLGGKGSGLAEMTNAGLPVPPGFTISTEVCNIYYKEKAKVPSAIDREIARLNFEGKLQAVVEEKDKPSQTLIVAPWQVTISYGLSQFGPGTNPPGNPEPTGRALIAQLGENEFLVAGFFCRVDFHLADAAKPRQFLRVEEGTYENGAFKFIRIWNGDQTDWGLNFSSAPQVLRVKLGTY